MKEIKQTFLKNSVLEELTFQINQYNIIIKKEGYQEFKNPFMKTDEAIYTF